MSRRVGLGKLGSSGYGLRVSRSGSDAVPASSSSAKVSIDDLTFDSESHVVGHSPIYRIYDVTVAAGTVVDVFKVTPGTYTGTFGETLSYTPIPFVFLYSGGVLEGDFWVKCDIATFDAVALGVAGVDMDHPGDEGWTADVTRTGFTVHNHRNVQRTFRLFLLNPSSL
jgi:hypothetical protein